MAGKVEVGAERDEIRSASEGLVDLEAKRGREKASNRVNSRCKDSTRAEYKAEGIQ